MAKTIIIMTGSVRPQSVSEALLPLVQKTVEATGAQVHIANLKELALPFFDGDTSPADEKFQIPHASVQSWSNMVSRADGIIMLTPEYNHQLSGVQKNAIDWLSRLPDQPLAGKPVLIQTSSMGVIGGARCQYHLRQILVFLDAMVMNKPEFMGGVIQNKVDPQTGEVVDQSTRDHLSGQLTAFGDYIKRVKS